MTTRRTKHSFLKKITEQCHAAGLPRYARLGPRKFTTAQLVLGLAIRAKWARTYRAASEFLDEYYNIRVHWTTLQKAAKRLPLGVWQELLRCTAPHDSYCAAIDSTGFSTTNPSAHYVRRIDGMIPRAPVKLSVMVDIDTRRIMSARVRLHPAGDVRDVHGLIRQSTCMPWQVLMDKGYDSEPLHEWFSTQGVWSIAPTRKRCRTGWHRKRLRDAFPEQEYHQRSIVESVIGRVKQRFGGTVLCHTARTVRAELFMRLIVYNITTFIRLFLQRPPNHHL